MKCSGLQEMKEPPDRRSLCPGVTFGREKHKYHGNPVENPKKAVSEVVASEMNKNEWKKKTKVT
jgi:hypothetical protein